jgi:Flp pilus assembly protein TadG
LRRDTHGAVIVEKLIAYFPTLVFFFATWQVAEMYTSKLIVDRAASAAGRAAAVVLADDPFFYDDVPVHAYAGARANDVKLAAGMILAAAFR